MKVIVLLNARAGRDGYPAADSSAQISATLADIGLEARLLTTSPELLTSAAAQAATQGVDVVVAAGGDGTISAVAAGLVGGPVPLGVLPLGTLNHFARDMHIPLDLPGACRAIATGSVQRIDVGEVNGQTFLNNSSIGIYPSMVRHRDEQRTRWRRKKWLAMALATLRVLRELPLLDVQLETSGQVLQRQTPLVFVGNNRYQFSLPALGARQRLDGGELSLHVANCTTRGRILRLALRGLLGRLRPTADFDLLFAQQLWVDTPKSELPVALDGEVFPMRPPLKYVTRPGSLAVIAPPRRH